MAIYTKTGDKGETGLVSLDPNKPKRVSKSSKTINAIGAIDEVNSYLGVCLFYVHQPHAREKLEKIQSDLFTIGGILAGANLELDPTRVKVFEEEIDKLEAALPVLKNFILPSGNELASHLFFARSLVRRAERSLARLHKSQELDAGILKYINRLSDYLFIIARVVNFKDGKIETIWQPAQKSKDHRPR